MGYSRRIGTNITYQVRSDEGIWVLFKRRSYAQNPVLSANDDKALTIFKEDKCNIGSNPILYRFVRHDLEDFPKISVLANPTNQDPRKYVADINHIEDLTKIKYREPLADSAIIEDVL